MKDLRAALAHVFWIGGGTGGGKSTIAVALAEKYGLERYNYDYHDARDHLARTRPDRHPYRHAFLSMSVDERWVLRSPDVMAEAEVSEFAERFEMVVEDLLAMGGERRIVADGFGLLPELVAPVLTDPRRGVWLLPTPEFRAKALAQRGWGTVFDGTSDHAKARANKLRRDELLSDHVQRTARELDLAVIEVDGTRSLAQVTTDVERHFAPYLITLGTKRDPQTT